MRPLHPVPIIFAFDHNFAKYCAVSVCSIALHSSHRHSFICLYQDISRSDEEKIKNVVDRFDCSVQFIKADMTLFEGWFRLHRFGIAAYIKIALFRHVHSDRVLYLDVDMIATIDISELLETRLNCFIGACLDIEGGRITRIPLKDSSKYFNAGMMLIDLQLSRDFDVYSLSKIAHDRYKDRILMVDQCILNHVLEGNVELLPQKWNKHLNSIPREKLDIDFSPVGEPALLHYSGDDKPWMLWSREIIRNYWLSYARIAGLSHADVTQGPKNISEWRRLADRLALQGKAKESGEIKDSIITFLLDKIQNK